jgi:type IV secretory pathway VirB2 component (pilin)
MVGFTPFRIHAEIGRQTSVSSFTVRTIVAPLAGMSAMRTGPTSVSTSASADRHSSEMIQSKRGRLASRLAIVFGMLTCTRWVFGSAVFEPWITPCRMPALSRSLMTRSIRPSCGHR